MNNTEVLNKLLLSTNSFAIDFQNDLYGYLYENDIQCDLFSKLRSGINGHVDVPGINEDSYKLNLIYSEYLQSFDLCCLNYDAISQLKMDDILKQHKGHDDYLHFMLPVLVAIELKYLTGKRMGNFQSFLKDENKLKVNIQETHKGKISHWLNLCFLQYDHVLNLHIEALRDTHAIEEVDAICIDCSYAITPTRVLSVKKYNKAI